MIKDNFIDSLNSKGGRFNIASSSTGNKKIVKKFQ